MMIDRLQPTGLLDHWSRINIAENVNVGMHMSKRSNFTMSSYDIYTGSGTDQSKGRSHNQYYYFLGPFLVGIATTVLIFGFELIFNRIIHFHRSFTGEQLQTNVIAFTW